MLHILLDLKWPMVCLSSPSQAHRKDSRDSRSKYKCQAQRSESNSDLSKSACWWHVVRSGESVCKGV